MSANNCHKNYVLEEKNAKSHFQSVLNHENVGNHAKLPSLRGSTIKITQSIPILERYGWPFLLPKCEEFLKFVTIVGALGFLAHKTHTRLFHWSQMVIVSQVRFGEMGKSKRVS